MSNLVKGLLAGIATAVVVSALMFALFRSRVPARVSETTSSPAPARGSGPVPVPTVPPASVPASARPCVVASVGSFHLRPTETIASVGTEYPTGTRVAVIAPGTLYRNGYLIYRVRVESDGAEGYLFLGPRELADCAP